MLRVLAAMVSTSSFVTREWLSQQTASAKAPCGRSLAQSGQPLFMDSGVDEPRHHLPGVIDAMLFQPESQRVFPISAVEGVAPEIPWFGCCRALQGLKAGPLRLLEAMPAEAHRQPLELGQLLLELRRGPLGCRGRIVELVRQPGREFAEGR